MTNHHLKQAGGLIALFLLFTASTVCAQSVVKIKKAKGHWGVSEDVTLKQAEERAFLEAKKEALMKAGVMENVWSVFGHVSQDSGDEFHEAYSQMSELSISGMVRVTDKKVEDVWNPEERRLYKVVTIDATVKKAEKPDASYVLELQGLEKVYRAGEEFSCSIKVHGTDSYIKFFWFDETGGALLYPNEYEKNLLFEKERVYSFPLSNDISYGMEKQNPAAASERVNIMVVATKTSIPYIGEVTYARLLEWIYSIPADQRCSFYDMMLIK